MSWWCLANDRTDEQLSCWHSLQKANCRRNQDPDDVPEKKFYDSLQAKLRTLPSLKMVAYSPQRNWNRNLRLWLVTKCRNRLLNKSKEWMNKWMNEWINKWMNEWMMHKSQFTPHVSWKSFISKQWEQFNEWMNERLNECDYVRYLDEYDKWLNQLLSEIIHLPDSFVCKGLPLYCTFYHWKKMSAFFQAFVFSYDQSVGIN